MSELFLTLLTILIFLSQNITPNEQFTPTPANIICAAAKDKLSFALGKLSAPLQTDAPFYLEIDTDIKNNLYSVEQAKCQSQSDLTVACEIDLLGFLVDKKAKITVKAQTIKLGGEQSLVIEKGVDITFEGECGKYLVEINAVQEKGDRCREAEFFYYFNYTATILPELKDEFSVRVNNLPNPAKCRVADSLMQCRIYLSKPLEQNFLIVLADDEKFTFEGADEKPIIVSSKCPKQSKKFPLDFLTDDQSSTPKLIYLGISEIAVKEKVEATFKLNGLTSHKLYNNASFSITFEEKGNANKTEKNVSCTCKINKHGLAPFVNLENTAFAEFDCAAPISDKALHLVKAAPAVGVEFDHWPSREILINPKASENSFERFDKAYWKSQVELLTRITIKTLEKNVEKKGDAVSFSFKAVSNKDDADGNEFRMPLLEPKFQYADCVMTLNGDGDFEGTYNYDVKCSYTYKDGDATIKQKSSFVNFSKKKGKKLRMNKETLDKEIYVEAADLNGLEVKPKGLSGGAIAGIVIGVLLLVGGVGVGAYCYCQKKKEKNGLI